MQKEPPMTSPDTTGRSVSIVVPCYRSATTLPQLLERIHASLDPLAAAGGIASYEVVFVVDGSPDDTATVAHSLADGDPLVTVVEMTRNFGQHNALVAGIRHARNDVVVTMDDDLQHPPEQIHLLLDALETRGADLVYAVPLVEEHGVVRSFASRMVKRALAWSGVANAEIVGAFRAFRTELRDGFADARDAQVNVDVILSWTTNRVVSVPAEMHQRAEGRSSYNLRGLIRHTLNMVTGYGTVPLRMATWLGFFCAALGAGLLIYVVVRYALGETTVQGFTTLAALISLFAGAQMLSIGVIGEYIGRQHFRSMNRPMYVVRNKNDAARP